METLLRTLAFFAILAFWTWLVVITDSWLVISLEMFGCVMTEGALFEIWDAPVIDDKHMEW